MGNYLNAKTLVSISKTFFIFFMAVPKKKTSKSKRNSRKSVWKNKASTESLKALSLAKFILYSDSKKFTFFNKNSFVGD